MDALLYLALRGRCSASLSTLITCIKIILNKMKQFGKRRCQVICSVMKKMTWHISLYKCKRNIKRTKLTKKSQQDHHKPVTPDYWGDKRQTHWKLSLSHGSRTISRILNNLDSDDWWSHIRSLVFNLEYMISLKDIMTYSVFGKISKRYCVQTIDIKMLCQTFKI